MRKFFILSMTLFVCFLSLTACDGVTTPSTSYPTVPDDGGMGSNDPQFISLLNQLDNPQKLQQWLEKNIKYKEHDGKYTPYEFYLFREGDCGDYACFVCYILNYHDYDVNFVGMQASDSGHGIAVFKNKNKEITFYESLTYFNIDFSEYSYFSVDELCIGISHWPTLNYDSSFQDIVMLSAFQKQRFSILSTIEDCVTDCDESFSETVFTSYEIFDWNYFNFRSIDNKKNK